MADMQTHIHQFVVVSLFVASTTLRAFAQHPAMPPGMTHEEHQAQMAKDADMKKRGAVAMGFDQDKTTHHFRLYATGGAIEVVANDAADAATVGQVRRHLKEIAGEFATADFGRPFATHGEMPPGVRTMQERRSTLSFQYEDMPTGARVRITTSDATAIQAVHEFLRYQIREHSTGDPLTIGKWRTNNEDQGIG
jgi:hypothetical protein